MDNGQDMARLYQYEKIRVQGYDSVSLNNNEQHGFKAKKLYFKECHLAGRQYHDVDEVWSDLYASGDVSLLQKAKVVINL